jgi:hypothetical protein
MLFSHKDIGPYESDAVKVASFCLRSPVSDSVKRIATALRLRVPELAARAEEPEDA